MPPGKVSGKSPAFVVGGCLREGQPRAAGALGSGLAAPRGSASPAGVRHPRLEGRTGLPRQLTNELLSTLL